MPANSTGTIAVNKDVDTYVATLARGGFYEFSPQDSTVRFSDLPANVASVGLSLVLPDNPSDGDEYEFQVTDGSCGTSNLILASIADALATGRKFTALPAISIPALVGNNQIVFVQPNSGARFQFDAPANAWIVFPNGVDTQAALFNIAGTAIGGGPVTPDNFAGGAAEILFAFLVTPRSSGFFRLDTILAGVLAAADADVKLEISVVPDVTAFSGGAVVGSPPPAPTMRYQAVTPIVVTGGAPTIWGDYELQEATGNIGHVSATLATTVKVPKPTGVGVIGCAIVVKLSTAAQALNTLSLAANVQEAA